jgi:hypothetical protein
LRLRPGAVTVESRGDIRAQSGHRSSWELRRLVSRERRMVLGWDF